MSAGGVTGPGTTSMTTLKEHHMLVKGLIIGVAALACATSASAQLPMQRGTMEFGAFGRAARSGNCLSLSNGGAGGGRIGMFPERPFWLELGDADRRPAGRTA